MTRKEELLSLFGGDNDLKIKYENLIDILVFLEEVKSYAERAGIAEVNPHKFRHTFSTTLYRRGLDVRMIQRLLGHSNINTTMIYIDSDMDSLRDAYKKCI